MNRNENNGEVVTLRRTDTPTPDRHLAAFQSYWNSMRKGGDVPRRSDIDPRGIEALLENAMIAERIAPGLARLRIAGSHLSDLMGMEVRGMPVSAFIAPEHRDELADALTELFERPAIIKLQLRAEGGIGRPALTGQMMLLPLRSDLGDISRALGCLVTQGGLGRAPRRFHISSQSVTRITLPQQRPAPLDVPVAQGLAEAPAIFDAKNVAPALHSASERPYLRLVKSD